MRDQLKYDQDGPVLLVGGYGTVGSELTQLAAARWPLLLAGRSPERAAQLCRTTGASARRWDLTDPTPFQAGVRAVVSLVNDPDDRVLLAALQADVPYVDVTRWTARLQRAAILAATSGERGDAAVLLSSGWMGGVVPLVAATLGEQIGQVETVETAIRYDMADRSGMDSIEFMDRLGVDFEVRQADTARPVSPLSDSRVVTIGADRTRVARIDTPEQFTLPAILGASTASTRIGFSSAAANWALIVLGKIGFFRRFRGDRWTSARRQLLATKGDGGVARLRIDVWGELGHASAIVTDPAGQAHLTAVGALLGLRRVLGEDGAPAPTGLVFPEQHPVPGSIPTALRAADVQIELTQPQATEPSLSTVV